MFYVLKNTIEYKTAPFFNQNMGDLKKALEWKITCQDEAYEFSYFSRYLEENKLF